MINSLRVLESCFAGRWTQAINVPDCVRVLLAGVFAGCAFKFVRLGGEVTSILDGAFQGCALDNIAIPAFFRCARMKYGSIAPDSFLNDLGPNAFATAGLTRFAMPPSVTKFGGDIFAGPAVKDTIQWIGAGSFRECEALQEVTLSGLL